MDSVRAGLPGKPEFKSGGVGVQGQLYDRESGMKWPIQRLKLYLQSLFGAAVTMKLFHDIQMVIAKSLLAVQHAIVQDKHCFELYGYDVMVDQDLVPWLIEVRPFDSPPGLLPLPAPKANATACWLDGQCCALLRVSTGHAKLEPVVRQARLHLGTGQRVAVAQLGHARRLSPQVCDGGRGAEPRGRGRPVWRQPACIVQWLRPHLRQRLLHAGAPAAADVTRIMHLGALLCGCKSHAIVA